MRKLSMEKQNRPCVREIRITGRDPIRPDETDGIAGAEPPPCATPARPHNASPLHGRIASSWAHSDSLEARRATRAGGRHRSRTGRLRLPPCQSIPKSAVTLERDALARSCDSPNLGNRGWNQGNHRPLDSCPVILRLRASSRRTCRARDQASPPQKFPHVRFDHLHALLGGRSAGDPSEMTLLRRKTGNDVLVGGPHHAFRAIPSNGIAHPLARNEEHSPGPLRYAPSHQQHVPSVIDNTLLE